MKLLPRLKTSLRRLGLTAWRGQFFGLNITGNNINSVYSKWAIEFSSTSGSIGIVVQGNNIVGPTYLWTKRSGKWIKVASGWTNNKDNKWENKCIQNSQIYDDATVPVIEEEKALAAIVSHPQLNLVISGNNCRGIFEESDYIGYGGVPLSAIPFRGQDTDGHQFLGDLRFGITDLTDADATPDGINSRSYTFHIKTVNQVTFTLPPHKIGKRLLFKNIGLEHAKLEAKQGKIDDGVTYTLPPYSFLEVEDDGENYWIVGSGKGGTR